MTPKGGTEILMQNLTRRVKVPSQINFIVSNCDESFLDITKKNILWQHLNTDQEIVQQLHETKDLYSMIIFVSEWQRKKFVKEFSLEESRTCVIKNAIEPIKFVEKIRSKKLKLIYTSTPWRGLAQLVSCFKNISGAELTVFSSTMIYGSEFAKSIGDKFEWLYNECRNTPNCDYRGYAFNQVIRNQLQSSNILAYPSTFEETSCLAAIEAGAAGCEIVTTPLGALPETCDRFALFSSLEEYQKTLQLVIDSYDPSKAKEISEYYNDKYSWNNRVVEWREFFNNI